VACQESNTAALLRLAYGPASNAIPIVEKKDCENRDMTSKRPYEDLNLSFIRFRTPYANSIPTPINFLSRD
jgi:hypothetical protein